MARTNRMVTIIHNNMKPVRFLKQPSRNDICPCGSNMKFKNCHIGNYKEWLTELLTKTKQND